MKPLAAILCLALALAGCSHKPRVHISPNSAPVQAAQREVKRHVVEARSANMRATAELREAGVSHSKTVTSAKAETEKLLTLQPRVASILAAAPLDLKPEVQTLADEVASLSALHASTVTSLGDTATHLAATNEEQARTAASLAQGEARANELEQKLGPAYLSAVEKQTGALNDLEVKAAEAQNKADHRGRILGLVCAVSAALAATRLVTLTNPYSFAYPVGAFALAYGVGRWLL